MSLFSNWTSTNSLFINSSNNNNNNNPNHSKLSFANVVTNANHQRLAYKSPLKGARAFRAAAHSVLSPANRQFMDHQEAEAERPTEDRKIILGGETFKVNEDLKVIEEEEDETDSVISAAAAGMNNSLSAAKSIFPRRRPPSLSKRDSTLSIHSSCSVDSDWSDEELEELERILDDIQVRSEAAEKSLKADTDCAEAKEAALSHWKSLKRQRLLAMQRLNTTRTKRLSTSNSVEAAEAAREHQREKAAAGTGGANNSNKLAAAASKENRAGGGEDAAASSEVRGRDSPIAAAASTSASSSSVTSGILRTPTKKNILVSNNKVFKW